MRRLPDITQRLNDHLRQSSWMQIEYGDDVYWFFTTAPRVWTVTKEVKFGAQYDRYEIRWSKKRWVCNCEGFARGGAKCKHVSMLKQGIDA